MLGPRLQTLDIAALRAACMANTTPMPVRVCLFVAPLAPPWFILFGSHPGNPSLAGPDSGASALPAAFPASFVAGAPLAACIMILCGVAAEACGSSNTKEAVPSRMRGAAPAHASSVVTCAVFVAMGAAPPRSQFLLLSAAEPARLAPGKTNMPLASPSLLPTGFLICEMRANMPNSDMALIAKTPLLGGKAVHTKVAAPGVPVDRPDQGAGRWLR